jgi:hypothetical protein
VSKTCIPNFLNKKNLAHAYVQNSDGGDDLYSILALNVFRKMPKQSHTAEDIYTQARVIALNLDNHPDARIAAEEEHEISQEAYVQKLHREALARMIIDMEERLKNSNIQKSQRQEHIPIPHMLGKLHETYVEQHNKDIHPQIISLLNHATRLDLAIQANKEGTAIEKLEDMKQTTIISDPQNVHSSQVNRDAKKIYDLLPTLENEEEILLLRNSIMEECKTCAKCTLVCNTMLSNVLSNVQHIDDTEHNILLRVWKRIHHPCNNSLCKELKESLLSALSECVTDVTMHVTCTVGRVNRVLASLTILDAHPTIAQGLTTSEMIKHMVYDAVQKDIQLCLGASPPFVVDWYDGKIQLKDISGTERLMLEAFRTSIQNTVRKSVMEVCHKYCVSDITMDRYLTECLAALD